MNKQRIWNEISVGTQLFISQVIPPHELRIPITQRTLPHVFAYFPPLIFMAYLARRPGTEMWLARMLLLPLVVLLSLRAAFAYMWLEARFSVYNWGQGLLTLCAIAKALEYAFTPGGHLKIGERVVGEHTGPAIAQSLLQPQDIQNGQTNGTAINGEYRHDPLRETSDSEPEMNGHKSTRPVYPVKRPVHSPSRVQWLWDALELLCSMRGHGWDYGALVYVPPRTASYYHRRTFLLHSLRNTVVYFFLLDFLESLAKLVPGVGSPRGGSIFLASEDLPYIPHVSESVVRYSMSTLISLMSGTGVMAGFNAVYGLLSLIGVGILHQDPRIWPPPFHSPFLSTSLNEFWAKRWHQILRRPFLIYGGLPFAYITFLLPFPKSTRKTIDQIATVLGAFLASGLYHEVGSLAMGRSWDSRVVWFFVMHGWLVIFERVWRRLSGRRVGGLAGTLWVYFWVIGVGQLCIDAWHTKGLAGGLVIPPGISPTRRVIFPFIERHTSWNLDTVHY